MIVMSRRDFLEKLDSSSEPALEGPVFVTENGADIGVWLSAEAYRALSTRGRTIPEQLSMHGGDFDFEPEKLDDSILRPAELD